MNPQAPVNPIDAMMERASEALAGLRSLEASALCVEALGLARRRDDFERMARICLPLQEARRWVRQNALETGAVRAVSGGADVKDKPGTECLLVQPPMVGVDARRLRAACWEAGAEVFVLCREPMTSAGLWAIVGVGVCVVRVRLEPPPGVEPAPDAGVTRDRVVAPIDPVWFARAGEALGDQAIVDAMAAGDPDDPPAWRVDDFLDRIEACPDHEKFLQALAQACRDAIGTRTPSNRRRRRGTDNPYSF